MFPTSGCCDFLTRARSIWERLMERADDGDARLAGMLREVMAGKPVALGPVWVPPIQVQ